MPRLTTARLTIVPFEADLMRATLDDPAGAAARLGLRAAPGWPNRDERDVLPFLAEELAHDPGLADWGMHLLIHTADRAIVGCAGLTGRPTPDGTVEIGYGIAPPYQGRGLATEAAGALIAWAFAQPAVRRVIASCLKGNDASRRVIAKLGLRPLPPTDNYLHFALRRGEWRGSPARPTPR